MALLRDPRVVAIREGARDIDAWARVARHLQENGFTELQVAPGNDCRPVQILDGDVLADGAGHDRVPLGLEARDCFHRIQAYGTLGASVVLGVTVGIAFESQGGHARHGDRGLRDTAARDADLDDPSVHGQPPFRT